MVLFIIIINFIYQNKRININFYSFSQLVFSADFKSENR